MSSRLGTIKTRLESLQTAGEGMDSLDEILGAVVRSSDETRVTATATGDAPLGTYQLEVTQLAAAERTYSDTFAASDSSGLFGTGTFSIQVGADAAVDITVDGTDNLNSVASKINSSGANVKAAVIFDGSNYRLQVSGSDTGASNAITFTETGTTLGLTDVANEIVAARDASFTIDGLAMTRSSNEVADAIPGVTLDLLTQTSGSVAITVDRDTEGTKEKMQTFVDSYNEVMRGINAEFSFSGVARVGNSLAGDSMLRSLQSKLSEAIIDPVSGLGDVDRLSLVGIRVQNDGTLELDDAELTAALASDADGVAAFFEGDSDASVAGFVERLDDVIESFISTDGLLSIRVDGLDGQVGDVDISIESMEHRIGKFEENLRAKFTNLELVMSGLNAQGQQLISVLSSLPTYNAG